MFRASRRIVRTISRSYPDHLLLVGDDPRLHGGHPVRLEDDPAGVKPHLVQVLDDLPPHLVAADDSPDQDPSAQGVNIVDHVPGAAQAEAFGGHAHDRNRRLGGDPGDAPPDVFVYHEVPDHHDPGVFESGDERNQ